MSTQEEKKVDNILPTTRIEELKQKLQFNVPSIPFMEGYAVDVPSEVVVPQAKSAKILERDLGSRLENESYESAFLHMKKMGLAGDEREQDDDEHSLSSFATVETTEALIVGTAEKKNKMALSPTSPLDLVVRADTDCNDVKVKDSVNVLHECYKKRECCLIHGVEKKLASEREQREEKNDPEEENESTTCSSHSNSEDDSDSSCGNAGSKTSGSTVMRRHSSSRTRSARTSNTSAATVQRKWEENIPKELRNMAKIMESRDIPSLQTAVNIVREEVEGTRQDLASAVNQIWNAFSLSESEIKGFVEKIEVPEIDFLDYDD